MPKLYLFSNGSGKVTTRVVPVRFVRAKPDDDVVAATGRPPIDDRGVSSGPTTGAFRGSTEPVQLTVRLLRQNLDDDAPLKLAPPGKLEIESGDPWTVPKGHKVDVAVRLAPSLQPGDDAPYSGDLVVHWLTANELELARLTVKVYKPVEVELYFYRVTVGDKTPSNTDDQIKQYVDLVNLIYEPAGVVFKPVISSFTAPTNVGKDGKVRFNVDLVLLLREAKKLSDGKVNVLIVDTFDTTLGGIGVSPRMAERMFAAAIFDTDPIGEGLANMAASGLIPDEYRKWELARRNELDLALPQDATTATTGGDFIKLGDTPESVHERNLKEYIDFLARYDVVFDPDGNIRTNEFMDLPDDEKKPPGKKLIARLRIPGIFLAINSKGGDPLSPADITHWGRMLAHELGHYFGLFHPNDPNFTGANKVDDIWSRQRLMFHATSFYRDQNAPAGSPTTSAATSGTPGSSGSPPAGSTTSGSTAGTTAGSEAPAADPAPAPADPPAKPPPDMTGVRDAGYGVNEPGTFLTHTHVQRGDFDKDPQHASFLDPAGGEIETIRKGVRMQLGGGS